MTRFASAFAATTLMFGTCLTPQNTRATELEGADLYVKQLVAEFSTIAQPAGKSTEETAARVTGISEFLRPRLALMLIARYTAGRDWRKMTTVQKANYTNALLRLASMTIASSLGSAEELKIEVLRTLVAPDAKNRPDRTIYIVKTKISSSNGSSLNASWRLIAPKSSFMVADVVVEGVSLLTTYRSHISELFTEHQGNADAVIAAMQRRRSRK